jgi:diguanylate cyclase
MNGTRPTPNSADLELAQCHIRLFIPLPILTLWYLYWFFHMQHPDAIKGLGVAAGFLVFAVAHWALVKRNPGVYPLRRIVAISVDQTACFVAMFMTGELGAVVAFVNLWISLGNGIRFGVQWMALSTALASTGLIAVGIFSDYWSQHPIWIISLVLLNTAIPAYVASLIRGFHHSRSELARYAGEMEAMALKDPLTGLPNRTALFDELDKAGAHARRTGTSIAVLYFDLDGFKQVNDSLGHAPGDMLLVETAKRANEALRGEDVLARIGGDEFVVLLQMQDDGGRAHAVAERILQSIAAIREITGSPIEVTASVGIVVVSGAEAVRMGAEQIVHEADRNMYLAKKQGKNQIVLSSLEAETSLLALQA